MLNKKSQVEDWLPLLLTMIFFVFLILFFSFLDINKDKTTQKAVEFEIITKDSNKLLINYLRSPLAFDNVKNSNMADAINYYFITKDKNFNKILNKAKKETKGIDYNKFNLKIVKDLPSGFSYVGFSKHSNENEKDMKNILLSDKKIALVFGDDKYGLTQDVRNKLDFSFRLTPELKKPLRGNQALAYVIGVYVGYRV